MTKWARVWKLFVKSFALLHRLNYEYIAMNTVWCPNLYEWFNHDKYKIYYKYMDQKSGNHVAFVVLIPLIL